MSEYSKITLNQLDINAVADYVIESRNLVYRNNEVDSSSNKAMDVDKVAGIDADNIAKSVDKTDRETVKNALQLGGLDASEYMTTTTGNSIATNQLKMKQVYNDMFRDMQDELYQLRNELIKSGSIEDRGEYNGYIDVFKRNRYINIQNEVCNADTMNTSKDSELHINDLQSYQLLDVYDFICIENSQNKTFDIKEIVAKNDAAKIITVDSDIRPIVRASEMSIFKSKGIIHNGLYKFANPAETQLGEEEYHTGLSDDTYNVIKRINESRKGYGYSFRVPEAKQGFITSLEICAKATGAPGALNCYIIDERDVDKFINPDQAAAEYRKTIEEELQSEERSFKFFAKAKPYLLDSALGKRYLRFDFTQPDGSYPLMTRDENGNSVRYVAIIEASSADASNYVDIVFLQHRNSNGALGDLELNNTTFYYKRQSDDSVIPALSTDDEINKTDMYYQVTTRGIVENEPEAQRQGLYSAHCSFINNRKPLGQGKARLALRIKREGMYKVDSDNPTFAVVSKVPLNVSTEDNNNDIKTIEDLRLKTDIYKRTKERENEADISEKVNVIVGNNITKIQGSNDNTITTQNAVMIYDADKLYRCGYLVNLKARRISMNSEGVLSVGKYDNYILNLVDVYKDKDGIDREWSDRLIFECDLFDKDLVMKNYNDFELQIFWENRELSNYSDIKRAQMGAIKDLVLSFNKAF